MDEKSLSHSRCDCKYHIVFGVKFLRKEIYGKIKADIGKLCEHKGVEIISAEACPRPYPHDGKYFAEDECFKLHGVLEREKYTNDI